MLVLILLLSDNFIVLSLLAIDLALKDANFSLELVNHLLLAGLVVHLKQESLVFLLQLVEEGQIFLNCGPQVVQVGLKLEDFSFG